MQERAAQKLACDYLASACERALFELRSSLAKATSAEEVRAGLFAAELLSSVLLSWREAQSELN
jgi:hypothetical protein